MLLISVRIGHLNNTAVFLVLSVTLDDGFFRSNGTQSWISRLTRRTDTWRISATLLYTAGIFRNDVSEQN